MIWVMQKIERNNLKIFFYICTVFTVYCSVICLVICKLKRAVYCITIVKFVGKCKFMPNTTKSKSFSIQVHVIPKLNILLIAKQLSDLLHFLKNFKKKHISWWNFLCWCFYNALPVTILEGKVILVQNQVQITNNIDPTSYIITYK